MKSKNEKHDDTLIALFRLNITHAEILEDFKKFSFILELFEKMEHRRGKRDQFC